LTIPEYFNQFFSSPSRKLDDDVNGKVFLGFIIYQDGKTCCQSFFNKTTSQLDPEIFKNAVNNMPNWKPALQNGNAIIFLNNLIVQIKDGVFIN